MYQRNQIRYLITILSLFLKVGIIIILVSGCTKSLLNKRPKNLKSDAEAQAQIGEIVKKFNLKESGDSVDYKKTIELPDIREVVEFNVGDSLEEIQINLELKGKVPETVIKEVVKIVKTHKNIKAKVKNSNGAEFDFERQGNNIKIEVYKKQDPIIAEFKESIKFIPIDTVKAVKLTTLGKITNSVKGFFNRMETAFWWVFWIILIVLGIYLYFRFKR